MISFCVRFIFARTAAADAAALAGHGEAASASPARALNRIATFTILAEDTLDGKDG